MATKSGSRNIDKPAISQLSLDTIVHILGYVDPQDILNMSQTCKVLRQAGDQRIVWVYALRRFCLSMGLGLAMFPVETMSIRALRHAVTAPTRFNSLLAKKLSMDELLQPSSVRILSSPSTINSGDGQPMYLLPGGRHLILAFGGKLELWDLGIASSSTPIRCVASVQTTEQIDELRVQHRAGKISVAVTLCSGGAPWESAIYEINLEQASEVSWRLVHRLEFQQILSILTFSGPYLLFVASAVDDKTLILFNHEKNLWAKFRVAQPPYSSIIHKDCIIFMAPKAKEFRIMIYNIPLTGLQPRTNDIIPMINLNHFRSMEVANGWGSFLDCFPGHRHQGHSSGLPDAFPVVDVVIDRGPETWLLHYELLPGNSADPRLPACVPVTSTPRVLPREFDYELREQQRIGGELMIPSWLPRGVDFSQMFWIDEDRGIRASTSTGMKVGTIWPMTDECHPTFDYCSYSGRVCIRSASLSGIEIRVMDFLSDC